MARRKNVKRIDPRYFLHETVNRDINTGEVLDEEREAPVTHWIAGPGGLVDQHGDVFVKPGTSFAATRKPGQPGMMVIGVGHGTSTERWFGERPVPYEDVQKHRSNSNYKPPQPGPEHRPRRGWNETVNRGEETLAEELAPAWFSVPDSTKRRIARHDPEDRTHSQEHGEIEEGKKEEIQALIDAGMISPEEAKNMLAGRRADQAAPSAPIPGLSDLGADDVDPDGKPSALKRKVAALAKKLGICEETMVEELEEAFGAADPVPMSPLSSTKPGERVRQPGSRPGREQMAAEKDKLYNTMGVVRRELHDLIKLHRQEEYRKDPQTKPTLEILRNLMDNITREYTQAFPPRDGNEE